MTERISRRPSSGSSAWSRKRALSVNGRSGNTLKSPPPFETESESHSNGSLPKRRGRLSRAAATNASRYGLRTTLGRAHHARRSEGFFCPPLRRRLTLRRRLRCGANAAAPTAGAVAVSSAVPAAGRNDMIHVLTVRNTIEPQRSAGRGAPSQGRRGDG